jgi:hypothetical protein
MISFLSRPFQMLAATLLIVQCAVPAPLAAQSHIVSPAQVQQQVQATSQARQQNEDKIREFVSSPEAAKAIKAAGMDPVQVKTAVSTLNDQELSQITARADKAQSDFAAGLISSREITLIIVAIAVIVIVIAVR